MSSKTIATAVRRISGKMSGERDCPIIGANDEQDEAVFVAKTIEELSREAGYKHRDFAVLYRTNAQSRTIEEALLNPTFPTIRVGAPSSTAGRERDVIAYSELDCQP